MIGINGKGGHVYVANVTMQHHKVNFRLPEARKPLSIDIPMGRQKLVGDFTSAEIASMVDQLDRYGLVEAGETPKHAKITFLYNVGSPLSAAQIKRALDRNRGLLRDEGKQRRLESAVAANAAMNTDETPVKNLQIDVEEIDSGDLGGASDNVGEGYRIDNEGGSNENSKPRRPSSRGKKGE